MELSLGLIFIYSLIDGIAHANLDLYSNYI